MLIMYQSIQDVNRASFEGIDQNSAADQLVAWFWQAYLPLILLSQIHSKSYLAAL